MPEPEAIGELTQEKFRYMLREAVRLEMERLNNHRYTKTCEKFGKVTAEIETAVRKMDDRFEEGLWNVQRWQGLVIRLEALIERLELHA